MNCLQISFIAGAFLASTAMLAQDATTKVDLSATKNKLVTAHERVQTIALLLEQGTVDAKRMEQLVLVYERMEAKLAELYSERDRLAAQIDATMAASDSRMIEMLGEEAVQRQAMLVKTGGWKPSLIYGNAASCAGHSKEGAGKPCCAGGAAHGSEERKH